MRRGIKKPRDDKKGEREETDKKGEKGDGKLDEEARRLKREGVKMWVKRGK